MARAIVDKKIRNKLWNIYTRYTDYFGIFGAVVFVLIGIGIGAWLFRDGYATNLYTEAISVVVTITVLDRMNDRRSRERATEMLKKRLFREAKGQSNEMAKAAIDWIRDEKWLTIEDEVALLKGKNLEIANLEEANLLSANLQHTNLRQANLQRAILTQANLQQATLAEANLREANLLFANLQQASLAEANLQEADLSGANLNQANLRKANLRDANLCLTNLTESILAEANLCGVSIEGTKFDSLTVLPDAKDMGVDEHIYDKFWTPNTDMNRYTNPEHPDFWQPDWVNEQNEA
jgi:uncharacterized protein YjbI with pentapeptide repeats